MSSPNRLALLSLISGVLTLCFFCVGWAPIPLTALVCYPAAVLGGAAAMFTGWRAVRLKADSERRWMAWTGIGIGGLSVLAVMCCTALSFFLFGLISSAGQAFWSTRQTWLDAFWQTILNWWTQIGG